MGKNQRLKVHRQWLPGRSLCSIRSNRKWCKRRGSSLECQNCFFVYPIIDSNLKNLIPVLSVYENIVLPVELDGRKIDKDFLDDVLDILSLKEKIFNLPNTLSGGQQQRVAIARAIISKPAVILADEPTGNLDSKTSGDVIKLLRTVNQRFEQTLIMITHNLEIAQLSDRIINIIDGKVDI